MHTDIRSAEGASTVRTGIFGQAADSLAGFVESMVEWVEIENGLAVAATGRWIDLAEKLGKTRLRALRGGP